MVPKRRRRLISAVGFGLAGVLLAVALTYPLAFDSNRAGSLTDWSFYYAGSQFKDVCTGSGCYSGWTATYQYAQYMDDLYTVAWWVLAAGILLSVLAFVVALVGAAGRPTALLTWVISVTGAGVAILVPLTLLAVQPHAYALDYNPASPPTGYFPCDPSSASTCTSFFGSTTMGSGDWAWGGGLGWYAALTAGVLLLLGAFISRPPPDDPRLWPARLAVLTILGAAVTFAVFYSVVWRQFQNGTFPFDFGVTLLVVPIVTCVGLGAWSSRRQRPARARGWTPS